MPHKTARALAAEIESIWGQADDEGRPLTAGNFYGAGPFGPSGNNAGGPGLFGESLWSTRVVLSTLVGSGTALVGNFGQAAHIWRRSGVTIEATNSHSDLFVKNISMLRAEERRRVPRRDDCRAVRGDRGARSPFRAQT